MARNDGRRGLPSGVSAISWNPEDGSGTPCLNAGRVRVTNQTTRNTVLPNKITPPEPGPFFARPALADRLGELSVTARKIWVSGPGGAGKTTLVRNFLIRDARPLVWYAVDVEDQDPASVFFYLSRTVPGGETEGRSLPQLSPERLPGFEVFCRGYFRAFFARFPQGCVLVFDDFQEGPGEPLFGPVLSAAMTELPVNSALFILSRDEPYPGLARERLNRSMAYLGWDDLQLSPDETRQFLVWSRNAEVSPRDNDRAYSLTHGWLAGLLLFAENPAMAPQPGQFALDRTDLLFDYFAGEIFSGLPAETQEFLLTCAVLPTVDSVMAERLTGKKDAAEMLRRLARGNHFTFRISTEPETYRFHPLFRQFLLARAVQEMDAPRLAKTRLRAASLLEEAGQTEAVAELLVAAQAWPRLIELIASQADVLLRQGRTRTLLVWLRALPDELRRDNPWLCYWQGCCLNAENPLEAKDQLERAFQLFDEAGNATGSMMTWTMMVYAIVVGWNELADIDTWVEKFYRLRERFPEYPSPEIEALMVQSICQALMWRQPSHPDLPAWTARLRQLIAASRNSGFRILAGADLGVYYLAVGDLAAVRALFDLLGNDSLSEEATPLHKLIWFAVRAITETFTLDHSVYYSSVDAGRAIVEESGIHVADVRLFGAAVVLALALGDLPKARHYLDELKSMPVTASLDQAYLYYLMADVSGHEGDLAKAVALAEVAVAKARVAGAPIVLAFALAVSVMMQFQTGHRDRARESLALGITSARGMMYFERYFNLLAAFFVLEDGDVDTACRMLRETLGPFARQNLNIHPWRDHIMDRLCRAALDAGIEVDYVRRLASLHRLDPWNAGTPNLTAKEIETLKWVIAGKTNWEIARILDVSERTVKFHVGNILQKLGANSRAHAVSIALERGIIDND